MNDLGIFQDPADEFPGEQQQRGGRRSQRAAKRRQRRKRAGGRAAVFFALAFLVAVFGTVFVFGYAWVDDQLHPPDYSGTGDGSVTLQIRSGETASDYGVRMQTEHIIKSNRAWVKVARADPRTTTIQPGFYNMRLHMSSKAALALLLDPKSLSANQISIPEGLRTSETIALLSKKTGLPLADFQAVVKNPAQLGLPAYAHGKVEGFLWPDRYDLQPNASAASLLKQMVDRFKEANADLPAKARAAGMTPGDIVTMASLIQAEAGKPADEPKIARVLYNRIKKKDHLQLDTTVLYALNKKTLAVTNKDTLVKSPYNTYIVKGLPVGAIDNPGATAIDAALNPAAGPWYWFVTTDPANRVTKFTDKESEFVKFRDELNVYLKAHPGS